MFNPYARPTSSVLVVTGSELSSNTERAYSQRPLTPARSVKRAVNCISPWAYKPNRGEEGERWTVYPTGWEKSFLIPPTRQPLLKAHMRALSNSRWVNAIESTAAHD